MSTMNRFYEINNTATAVALKSIIDSKGFIYDEVADAIGVRESVLKGFISGARTPTLMQACLLSQVLDCDIEDFVVINYNGQGKRLYKRYRKGLY